MLKVWIKEFDPQRVYPLDTLPHLRTQVSAL